MKTLTDKFVLTKKSQITLPKQVREFLGVKPGEQITFVIEDNSVKIMPVKSKLEENFGKVKPIQKPEDFKQIREFVEKEIAEESMKEI
jgi:AbrB family looped-hinge helix DNA binding protein